jgi:hypothetical protein
MTDPKTTHPQALFALAHPVFDPDTQIVRGHRWRPDRLVTACLTANIGME